MLGLRVGAAVLFLVLVVVSAVLGALVGVVFGAVGVPGLAATAATASPPAATGALGVVAVGLVAGGVAVLVGLLVRVVRVDSLFFDLVEDGLGAISSHVFGIPAAAVPAAAARRRTGGLLIGGCLSRCLGLGFADRRLGLGRPPPRTPTSRALGLSGSGLWDGFDRAGGSRLGRHLDGSLEQHGCGGRTATTPALAGLSSL